MPIDIYGSGNRLSDGTLKSNNPALTKALEEAVAAFEAGTKRELNKPDIGARAGYKTVHTISDQQALEDAFKKNGLDAKLIPKNADLGMYKTLSGYNGVGADPLAVLKESAKYEDGRTKDEANTRDFIAKGLANGQTSEEIRKNIEKYNDDHRGGDIFSKVSDGLTHVAKTISEDPKLRLAVSIGASFLGVPPNLTMAAMAANDIGQGADPEKVAKGMAAQYLMSAAAGSLDASSMKALQATGIDMSKEGLKAASTVLSNASVSAIKAAATGKNIGEAVTQGVGNGLIAAASNYAGGKVSDDKSIASSVSSGLKTVAKGGSAEDAVMSAGLGYLKSETAEMKKANSSLINTLGNADQGDYIPFEDEATVDDAATTETRRETMGDDDNGFWEEDETGLRVAKDDDEAQEDWELGGGLGFLKAGTYVDDGVYSDGNGGYIDGDGNNIESNGKNIDGDGSGYFGEDGYNGGSPLDWLTSLVGGASSTIGKVLTTGGTAVTSWLNSNKELANIIANGVSNAEKEKAAAERQRIANEGAIDQLNLKQKQKLEDNERFSNSITGLRSPGLISMANTPTQLRRTNGNNVFGANGGLISQGA